MQKSFSFSGRNLQPRSKYLIIFPQYTSNIKMHLYQKQEKDDGKLFPTLPFISTCWLSSQTDKTASQPLVNSSKLSIMPPTVKVYSLLKLKYKHISCLPKASNDNYFLQNKVQIPKPGPSDTLQCDNFLTLQTCVQSTQPCFSHTIILSSLNEHQSYIFLGQDFSNTNAPTGFPETV